MQEKIISKPNTSPDTLHHCTESGGMRGEYIARINRVIDYIDRNIYDELTLEKLAEVADFSRFHFHRIFRAMVGETLNRFIQRVRVEKAARQLSANPGKSITDIAFDCGFSGSAAFARVFKEVYGMSAGQWRTAGKNEKSKICKVARNMCNIPGNIGKDVTISTCYYNRETSRLTWRITMKDKNEIKVEVKEMPEYQVAYVRHIGPYKGNEQLFKGLFEKLMKWAGPRDLLRFPETRALSIYHDDPNITEEDKLRTSACITVPEETKAEGEVGRMTVPGGKFAVARVEIDADEYEASWNMLMADWLPESGFQPDDRYCYALYQNNPEEHPQKKHILDICIPVKPL
ncbi:MAG: AraC family transcriptional regulator [bacterium]|nr:AraC family transcriptional regulator [bacterium]